MRQGGGGGGGQKVAGWQDLISHIFMMHQDCEGMMHCCSVRKYSLDGGEAEEELEELEE